MPNYRYDQESAAIDKLGDKLYRGLYNRGRTERDKSDAELRRTQILGGLKRQSEMDKLRRPGLQLQADRAQRAIDDRNSPVTIPAIWKDHWQIENAFWRPKGGKDYFLSEKFAGDPEQEKRTRDMRPAYQKFGAMFNAQLDSNKNSPTYGKYVKDDGSLLTMGEIEARKNEVLAFHRANVGRGREIRQMDDRVEEAFAEGRVKDLAKQFEQYGFKINPAASDQQVYNDMKRAIFTYENDPVKQIQLMEDDIKFISQFKGFDQDIERKRRSIQKLKDKMQKTGKQLTPSQRINKMKADRYDLLFSGQATSGQIDKALNDLDYLHGNRYFTQAYRDLQNDFRYKLMTDDQKMKAVQKKAEENKQRDSERFGGKKTKTEPPDPNDPFGIK